MKKEKVDKKQKQEKTNKFIQIIKNKCIKNTVGTVVLTVAIFAFFIGVTVLMQKLQLTPLDFTEDKVFTLTEESKEQVKNIEKEVNIYFVGYSEEKSLLDLARQYQKANEKISVEAVNAEDRPDLVQKYGIETGSIGIIVESGEKCKVLTEQDLYTYDYTTYESINVAEEKLTLAIKSVVADELPKVYFLNGYSTFSLNNGMYYFGMYLQNEINEIEILDILSTGEVPEDCDTLVITSPEKDFDEIATNAILDYINKGGNILWLNAALVANVDMPNVNKVLATYGINPFEAGTIRETDASKMIDKKPYIIIPEVQYADVTKKVYGTEGIILKYATKINVAEDKLTELNVTKTDLVTTSESSYFRTNFDIKSNDVQQGEEQKSFIVGAQFDKKINEEKTSKLIIYGDNYFISDYTMTETTQSVMLSYRKNKDLVLNTISYLTNREEDITVRKNTGSVTYTPTELEHRVITIIIFGLPIIIIIAGIVVWQIRRRKK